MNRPRHKYALPDGRPITVIGDHDRPPAEVITLEIRQDDPLWHKAQRASNDSNRRLVYATLSQGM